MTQLQRIAMQRVLFAEAMGKLKAINELFGVENMTHGREAEKSNENYRTYDAKLSEFEKWFYDEGPCA